MFSWPITPSCVGVTSPTNKDFRGLSERFPLQTGVVHDTSLRHACDARSQDLM